MTTKTAETAVVIDAADQPTNLPAIPTSATAEAAEFQGAFDAKAFRVGLKKRLDNRHTLIEWVRENLVAGVDYGRIHVVKKSACPTYAQTRECTNAYHWSKPSLWKPGAEKICGMLGWVAAFPNLSDYTRMIRAGREIKQVVLQCVIVSGGRVIGEGIGARNVSQDDGDLNKTLKMCKKSAHIDATLVAAGLSEVFTQDYGDGQRDKDDDDDEGKRPVDQYTPGAERGDTMRKPQPIDVRTHCPFGKHKGEPWAQVDAGYLDWIVANIHDKPDVLGAAQAEIKRRQEAAEQPQHDPSRPHAQGSKGLADHARAISTAKTTDECTAAYDGAGTFQRSLKKTYESRLAELKQRAADEKPM